MSTHKAVAAQLAHAGWAVLGWVDDTVKGRRELAQALLDLRETERLLSAQLELNGRLMTRQSWDAAGGAE